MIKTNNTIHLVLKKRNLTKRMVSFPVGLFEYDIQYTLRGSIKLQVLGYFLAKFNFLVGEEIPHIWILIVDVASNLKDDSRIVLEGPTKFL